MTTKERECERNSLPSKCRCKICYQREKKKDPLARSVDIKKRCSNPSMGCVVCKIYVCVTCWPVHLQDVRNQRQVEKYHQQDGTKNQNKIAIDGQAAIVRPASYQRKRHKKDNDSNVKSYTSSLAKEILPPDSRSGSLVMESLFGTNGTNWKEFVETIWRKKTRRFTYDAEIPSSPAHVSLPSSSIVSSISSACSLSSTSIASKSQNKLVPAINGGDGRWRKATMTIFPLKEIIRQGWHILSTLMASDISSHAFDGSIIANHDGNNCNRAITYELLVDQTSLPKTSEEIHKLYGSDLYAAYLAGYSITWAYADLISPHIAALCVDLEGEQEEKDEHEKGGAFSQTFSSAHLSPPYSKRSSPKTNDRNILVVQLAGKKHWRVFLATPEVHPHTHEMVFPVSGTHKFEEPLSFDDYLYPGDSLYIPNGVFYQQQADSPDQKVSGNDENESSPSMSFHVTVNLSTSDSCLTRIFSKTARTKLPPPIGIKNPGVSAEISTQEPRNRTGDDHKRTLLSAKRIELIQHAKQGTPTEESGRKQKRGKIGSSMVPASTDTTEITMDRVVGSSAAKDVSFHSIIRASTQEELNYAQKVLTKDDPHGGCQRLLHTPIREEIRCVLEAIVNSVKETALLKTPTSYVAASQKEHRRASSLFRLDHHRVVDLCELVKENYDKSKTNLICDLTLLSFVKRKVKCGDFAVVQIQDGV